MSDSTESTSTETTTEETSQAEGTATTETPATETPEGTEGKGTEQSSTDTEDTLPEWARKELTKTRGEAANYRTKLREAESALKNAKSVEEFEAARTEMSEQITKLERSVLVSETARKFNLPDDLAERLTGDNKEELEADAKKLQKYAPATAAPENLSGGLDPSDDADDDDPVKAVAAARASRRRF